MRVAVLWTLLAIGNGVFLAMLVALWRHRAQVTTPAQPKTVSENVWAMVPWLIVAFCAAPAVHHTLATNQAMLVASTASEPLAPPRTHTAAGLLRGLDQQPSQSIPVLHGGTMGDIPMQLIVQLAKLRSFFVAGAMPIVFIVDDDVSVRESLEALVADAGYEPKVFASAHEFLDSARPSSPSCLVLDMRLPDLNGLEIQKRVAGDRADMPIIFMTGHADVPMTVQAMKGGAVEFLTKPFGAQEFLSAIRSAIERSNALLAEEASLQDLRKRHSSLSARERDVMALVVRGQMNKQVGRELEISEITVKAHRGRVMRKMQVKSLAELVTVAARLGIPASGPST